MNESGEGNLAVLITAPSEQAAVNIARILVEERLAACVNIVPQVRSIYRWDGVVQDEPEALMIAKTRRERFDALRARVVELHSYSCPEVVALTIERGHEPYLQWLGDSTRA